MEYPLTFSTIDGSTLYDLDDKAGFRELKRLGERYLPFEFKARDYPDHLFIDDLVNAYLQGKHSDFDREEFELLWKDAIASS